MPQPGSVFRRVENAEKSSHSVQLKSHASPLEGTLALWLRREKLLFHFFTLINDCVNDRLTPRIEGGVERKKG